ncbi:DEAD/DEAH box helicase family protein [Vibrio sp. McD22-P3]|uniref:DEAD/DEAH box helicase family protein n=1 Tax=Vibrio sp. McD22-P3 TaxID=2724880 RepID=UPI001F1CBCD1|nr:DEAD/DEAH box helicase family protein [Vibrio sp. McD22-P3]MCF4174323.1 DEAD/DEAH box helicase family protein [Vibrio sp. McD22-P3]
MNNSDKHRKLAEHTISNNTYPHQREAAQQAFNQFKAGSRAVVIAAEMQSGKSGVALALSCLQRLSLSDEVIIDRKCLKDTLYLVTMADLTLQEQAKQDLSASKNVVVSNFTNFESAIKTHFKFQAPKLIIIDECHYGSSIDSVRYDKVFNYLEHDNRHCNVAFVSATPFSALYAAGEDSILRHNFNTSLVFHKTSNEYHGIRQMHRNNQIIKLDENSRDFCDSSLLRNRFIRQIKEHEGSGWSLIRVPSSQAKIARDVLLSNGIEPHQIHIIGQKLVGLEEHELCSINDFKREYETAALFDDKLIAITVAGFRAGVNFGQEMKETLINSWDSTIANIAAVVQANIGRACGYHENTTAKHYTNLDAVRAYGELLDHLESNHNSHEFEGLHQLFDQICSRYEVRGFDRGTTIAPVSENKITKKLTDSKTYSTKGYIAVPGKLRDPDFDFSIFTTDPELLEAISLIRQELIGDDGPYRKKNRALRGEHQNWIKAQWVNGATYDDGTQSCAKARALAFTSQLNQGEKVSFNQVVNPGGGEKTEDKRVMASIFSTYNLSGQMDAFKRSLDSDDMEEICSLLDVEQDNTLIVLYQRGSFLESNSEDEQRLSHDIQTTRIRHNSVF